MPEAPHSEFVLSDLRDDWWNDDFLQLMAKRLSLSSVTRLLDVGSGHGHWGQLLSLYTSAETVLLGIERERKWVEKATERCQALGLSSRCSYRVGDAETFEVPPASFDMVTCQTLLMHVSNPEAVLVQMKKALAPGGLLLLAEPNNLATLLSCDSVQQQLSVETRLAVVRFHLRVNAGRVRVGEGDHSIGSRLPDLLASHGFGDIRVYLNDLVMPVYAATNNSEAVRSQLDENVRNIRDRAWLWEMSEAQRLYLAGGGSDSDFEADYGAFMSEAEAFIAAVEQGRYSGTGASQHFLISARKAKG